MTAWCWWTVAPATVSVLAAVGVGAVLSAGPPGGPSARERGDETPRTTRPGGPETPMPPARDETPRPGVPLLRIQSYAMLEPDRLQIRYSIGVPDCYGGLGAVRVVESVSEVVVRLHHRRVARVADRPCIEIAIVEHTVVELSNPLGDRAVVDGSSGLAVPARPVGH